MYTYMYMNAFIYLYTESCILYIHMYIGNISYNHEKPLILTGKLPSGRGGASVVYADSKV
jgi:hypothetical protein